MAHGLMMANNPNLRDIGAPTALICESSRDIYERGFRNLNLMAGNMDRLSAFYSSLNPNLLPYFSVKKFSLKGNIMRTLEKYLLGLALRLK